MIFDLWKTLTVILGVILIGMTIQPIITGLTIATTNEVVDVELFVMSHCPYGTQAEKGILPAIEALGSNVNFKIRFVYYAMHGKTEVDEELVQYCIQKEQPSLLIDYLWCFLDNAAGSACLSQLGIDVSSCVASADAEFGVTAAYEDQDSWLSGYYPLFPIDSTLNELYGVGGSPTLIIEGVQAQPASRSPQAYLNAICAEFETKPAACSQALSNVPPSAGFGLSGSGSASAATCG